MDGTRHIHGLRWLRWWADMELTRYKARLKRGPRRQTLDRSEDQRARALMQIRVGVTKLLEMEVGGEEPARQA